MRVLLVRIAKAEFDPSYTPGPDGKRTATLGRQARELLARNGWQVNGQSGILIHGDFITPRWR